MLNDPAYGHYDQADELVTRVALQVPSVVEEYWSAYHHLAETWVRDGDVSANVALIVSFLKQACQLRTL